MDMKHILQVLDKSSSRKIEGANDMRRFVSIVHENNTLKKVADKIVAAGSATRDKLDDFRPYDEKAVAKMYGVKTADNSVKKEAIVNQSDPKYVEYVQLMAKYDMLAKEMIPDNSGVEKGASPDAIAEINKIKAKAQQLAGANLQAWEQARQKEEAASMAQATANQSALAAQLEEAGKPGDPGFKPNLQVPQAPPFPEGDFSQPGPYDLGNGEKLTVNQDGTRVHSSGAGTFTYDKAGKAIKYTSPNFSGLSQEHDLVTGNITVKYINGPMNIVKTYDKTGKETGDSNAEYDMGTQTVAQKRTAGGQVQNTVTPAGGTPQPAPAPAPATEGKKTFADYLLEASKKCNHTAKGKSCPMHGLDECGTYEEDIAEVAGPKNCWPGHRKVGTKPGTGKNKGKRVNDCEKI